MNNRFRVFIMSSIILYLFMLVSLEIKIYLRKKTELDNIWDDSIMNNVRIIQKKVKLYKGKRYAYHPVSDLVEIEDKRRYTILDSFKILHEMSHAEDKKLTKRVLIIKYLYNIVFLPVFFYMIVVIEEYTELKICVSIIMLIIAGLKVYLTYYIEKKASENAYNLLTMLVVTNRINLKIIQNNYIWAYRSQTLESAISIPLIIMITSVM